MKNKPIQLLLILVLIAFVSPTEVLGQNYTCNWNSNRDHFFLDGMGSMPERYREDYKQKVRKRKMKDSYRAFRKNAKVNEPVLKKKFYEIKYIVNNRIVVRDIRAKLGIVDNSGKKVLESEYNEIFLFINQQGWLLKKGFEWSLVDTNFQEIIEDKFKDVMIISDDHFLAKKKGSTDLYLCHSGKGIIKNFGDVCFQAGYVGSPTYIVIRDGEEKSLYNTDGEKIYDLISRDRIRLVNKRFSVNHTPAFTINRNKKFGLIAADGSYEIPIKFKRIQDVSADLDTDDIYFDCFDGTRNVLYKFGDSILVSDHSIHGSVKKSSGVLRRPRNQKSQYLIYTINDKKGLYNIKSGLITEPKYDRLFQWTNNTLAFENNRLYGLIDSLDNEILPGEFYRLHTNLESIIAVKDKIYAVYDLNGKIIMPAEFEHIRALEKDKFGNLIRATFTKNGKKGFYDETFKEVLPPIYDNAKHFRSGLASVEIGGKWGFINKDGTLVIPAIYDKSAMFKEESADVKLNDKKISINKNGDCIKNCN